MIYDWVSACAIVILFVFIVASDNERRKQYDFTENRLKDIFSRISVIGGLAHHQTEEMPIRVRMRMINRYIHIRRHRRLMMEKMERIKGLLAVIDSKDAFIDSIKRTNEELSLRIIELNNELSKFNSDR